MKKTETKTKTAKTTVRKSAVKPKEARAYRSPNERRALVKAMGKAPPREYAKVVGISLGTLRRWIKEVSLNSSKAKARVTRGTKAPK